jgi:lipopolysaccharide biosynthesis protein
MSSPRSDEPTGTTSAAQPDVVRSLAFYLPQYHPIPENDAWWGRGFTEWHNVSRARRQFPRHHQPHLPGELGFYDLRVSETRERQAELAREHRIDGFVYYHYWFGGRQLLERPLAEVLASGRPDFPFCICWANEPWTRNWDGQSRSVLMAQNYSAEDDVAHFRALLPMLEDPRYIRFEGKPLIIIWQADSLPDASATTARWRAEAARAGLGELYLCRIENDASPQPRTPEQDGFDAAIDFQPHWKANQSPQWYRLVRRALRRRGPTRHFYHSYSAAVAHALAAPPPPYRRWPSVFPSWDNTSRRPNNAEIFVRASPERFREAIIATVNRDREIWPAAGERLLFVNAWNEWAEGCHLEPDSKFGRAWLEAHADALVALRRRQA